VAPGRGDTLGPRPLIVIGVVSAVALSAPLGDYGYTAVDEQGSVWAGVEYIAQTCSFAAWIGGDLTSGGHGRGHGARSRDFATRVMELR